MSKIRPYSRPDAFAKIDGRTWQAKLVRETRADLLAHVGSNPSATQRALIDRCAWLTLHIAQIDRRTADGKAMTPHDAATYLAWSNSLSRTLTRIGLKSAASAPPSLKEHLAARAAQAAA